MYDPRSARAFCPTFRPCAEADGFTLQRVSGSHRIYKRFDGRRIVVAYHALNDSFPIGTLRSMIADAGWQDEDLVRLGLLE